MTPTHSNMLTNKEAASYLRLSYRTLERLRVQGTGPRFMKAGSGAKARVLYDVTDLQEWLTKFASTSEYRR